MTERLLPAKLPSQSPYGASSPKGGPFRFLNLKGFVPASKADILADTKRNGKDYALRRHGNLTTFEGLVEFRKLVQRDSPDEAEADVIKYDYQILDDAYWLLTRNNFQIVNRGK